MKKLFFSEAKKKNPGLYYKGIFFTDEKDGLTKGESIMLMLKQASAPKVVVMVDDRKENLASIQKDLE